MTLLEQIADWFGYEKKSPSDTFNIVEIPRPRVKSTIVKPDSRDKKIPMADEILERASDKSASSSSASSVKKSSKAYSGNPSMPPTQSPRKTEVDIQDPRGTQFEKGRTPEEAVESFQQNPVALRLLEDINTPSIRSDVDLSNQDPPRENIQIANEFTDKYHDQFINDPRVDLSSAMALADFWTGGKSKMAQAYKPPKSFDELYKEMMDLRSRDIKQRDDSEIAAANQKVDAYEKLVLKPLQSIQEMSGRILQNSNRDESSVIRAINMARQSGENNYTDNVTRSQNNLLDNRTQKEIAIEKLRAEQINLDRRINAQLAKKGGRNKSDYWKDVDYVLGTIIAPKFTVKGKILDPEDKASWGTKNSQALGRVLSFADYVIVSRGYTVANTPIEDLMSMRTKVLNEIAAAYSNGQWMDREIGGLYDEYFGSGKK
jgi:hypothetical protein